jgi:signal transduction histidine kinase
VEDDGPGIPARDVPHVFERFYRVDGSTAAGSGLGLAIARELADLMRGTLELHATPGRTIFALVLPSSGAGLAPFPGVAFSRENGDRASEAAPSLIEDTGS